jgi:hypothetical protein
MFIFLSMNKLQLPVLVWFLILTLSCNNASEHSDKCFSRAEQLSIIRQCVYFSVKLPPGATHETKFNSEFDHYFDVAASEYDLRACVVVPDSTYYFLMTRKARSIWPAREAIGGKLKVNSRLRVEEYEEVFRTWKMTEDSLNARAFELFDLMVNGKDLTPYRSKYKGDRYIEFPDDRFYFDKQDRRWKDSALDTLEIK